MGGAPPPFEARHSLAKLAGWVGMAAPLAAGSVWMLARAAAGNDVAGMLGGALGTLFFGGALVAFLFRAADRRVQLRIDGAGLYLRPHSGRTIPLRSIRKVELATGMVRAFLYKPSKYPVESRFRRFVYRLNGASARAYFGDAWLWTTHYDCNWEQILAAMNAHAFPTGEHQDLVAAGEQARP